MLSCDIFNPFLCLLLMFGVLLIIPIYPKQYLTYLLIFDAINLTPRSFTRSPSKEIFPYLKLLLSIKSNRLRSSCSSKILLVASTLEFSLTENLHPEHSRYNFKRILLKDMFIIFKTLKTKKSTGYDEIPASLSLSTLLVHYVNNFRT